jgi:hypothetical protein
MKNEKENQLLFSRQETSNHQDILFIIRKSSDLALTWFTYGLSTGNYLRK